MTAKTKSVFDKDKHCEGCGWYQMGIEQKKERVLARGYMLIRPNDTIFNSGRLWFYEKRKEAYTDSLITQTKPIRIKVVEE